VLIQYPYKCDLTTTR